MVKMDNLCKLAKISRYFISSRGLCFNLTVRKRYTFPKPNSCYYSNKVAGNEVEDDEQVDQLLSNFNRQIGFNFRNNVFVIQPKIKWGPHKNKNSTPDLMLDESVALAETLPNWKVCGTSITNVDFNTKKKAIFSTGLFAKLTSDIKQNPLVNSIFINVDMLDSAQHKELYESWRVPIYDRYNLLIAFN